MAPFAPNYETVKRVEAYPIAAVGPTWVTVDLPNGGQRSVPVTEAFSARPPAVGDMLVRYVDGYLSHCPADVFFRDAVPLDANLVEPARTPVRSPVVEEPRVPRRDGGLPHGRHHP
ncbi:hypothetical protein MKK64_17365 [Methylobacterium sp. E-025]|uniref:hypothetical protein n=1 Tax=Methylobacterium sp. E-025 TaxID=2836561 RepID=UPI001FBBE59D|nr:hypothetical protein [Methylobacterium sp. E-025]MCJ2112953.1 hypothetical protein [Methylobacterium sp. E-025]